MGSAGWGVFLGGRPRLLDLLVTRGDVGGTGSTGWAGATAGLAASFAATTGFAADACFGFGSEGRGFNSRLYG